MRGAVVLSKVIEPARTDARGGREVPKGAARRQCIPQSRVLIAGLKTSTTESLILAQNERWRRGLGMQVERFILV